MRLLYDFPGDIYLFKVRLDEAKQCVMKSVQSQ